jgi:acyl-CoA dehydrogenase
MGVGYPEEVGGAGGDLGHVLAVSEELVVAGTSVGAVVGLGSHGIAAPPIVKFGTAEQRARWVAPVLAGRQICALAITEPGGGSDVAGLTTRAVRDGDHYVVTGAKTFITSGVRADWVLAAVRTGGPGHGGISFLVIERGTEGFHVSKQLKKTGWWASDTAELAFDHCRVPVGNRIGLEHGAFSDDHRQLRQRAADAGRAMRGHRRARLPRGPALRQGAHRLRQADRRLPGHPPQAGRHGDPARRRPRPDRRGRDPGAARRVRARAVRDGQERRDRHGDRGVRRRGQIFGGAGYLRETVVERLYRDARLYPIGGGTREIMNEIITKTEGY